jgi:hypothetical protein
MGWQPFPIENSAPSKSRPNFGAGPADLLRNFSLATRTIDFIRNKNLRLLILTWSGNLSMKRVPQEASRRTPSIEPVIQAGPKKLPPALYAARPTGSAWKQNLSVIDEGGTASGVPT